MNNGGCCHGNNIHVTYWFNIVQKFRHWKAFVSYRLIATATINFR